MQDVLSVLARVLRQVGLSHALIGGHAVNAWLEPRFTADIDLAVASRTCFVTRPSEPRARSVGPDGMLAQTLPRRGGSGRFGRVGGSIGAERRALSERKTIQKQMVMEMLSMLSKNTQRIE